MYTQNFKNLMEDSEIENTALYFKLLKMFQEADREIEELKDNTKAVELITQITMLLQDRK